MTSGIQPSVLRYALAIVLSFTALALSLLLPPLSQNTPLLLFFASVVLSAWYGGLKPGLLAALLGVMMTDYFLLHPGRILVGIEDVLPLATFTAIAFLVSWQQHQRQTSTEALQAAHRQLEIILNGVTDGIIAHGKDKLPIFANDAAASLLGYPSAAALMESPNSVLPDWLEYLSEEGVPIPREHLPSRRAADEGVRVTKTLRLHFKQTGEECWLVIKAEPVFRETGRVHMVISILRDITEQKRAEQSQRKSEERLNSLVANVPGIIWEEAGNHGTNQRVVYVNSYAETMLGYPVAEWLNDESIWKKIIHPEDREAAVFQTQTLYESGGPGIRQFRCLARDGRVVPVETHTSLAKNAAGEITGIYGVMMDVSERKQSELALARYARQLRRSNEELQKFAYVASHDLQEPLRMVTSYLQLIENRYSDRLDDDAREFIYYAVDGAARMKSLISALLTYSRVETSEREFKPVETEQALQLALKNLQLAIEDSQATVTYQDLPCIKADEVQMTQLFQNLISNALKFRSEAPPQISISAKREKDEWVFAVKDNGIGIEQEYLDRIFVIFQRLHTKEKYPGTGIGLSVCKKVVERHGGSIWVESEPGHGANFYFTIPDNIN